MGTWGSGIYDDDSTRDYIDGIIKYLSNGIRDIMKWDYTLLHPGMTQSYLFMCHIDLLYAICSREDLYTSLPETNEIKKWKAKYLEVWEFCIEECEPTDDYRTERIKVIKKNFNNLLALAKRRDKEELKHSDTK